jgi:hypothetical protein
MPCNLILLVSIIIICCFRSLNELSVPRSCGAAYWEKQEVKRLEVNGRPKGINIQEFAWRD